MLRTLGAAALAISLAACATPKVEAPPVAPTGCGARDISVYFDGQSTELSADARAVIDATGAGLTGCRITHVRIIGASDDIGAESTNETVSELRAKVLADYVIDELHWPGDTIEKLATGERGAVTDDGLKVPMRRRARIIVEATTP